MASSTVFLLFFIIAYSSTSALSQTDNRNLIVNYPTEFYYSRELIDLVNSNIETAEIWHSAKNHRSRIDFYNGTNKEYYVATSEYDLGYKYTIFPITTQEVKNKKICLKEMYTKRQPSFLPVLQGFRYSHDEVQRDGKQIHVYTDIREIELNKWRVSTRYLYRNDEDYDIPLKSVTKLLNVTNGAVLEHTITNYNQFNLTIYADEVTMDDEACKETNQTDFNTLIKELHHHNQIHVNIAFHSYKKHHNKTYEKTEEELRKSIFHSNWRYVHAHNSKNSSFTMELNAFADRTEDELKVLTGSRISESMLLGNVPFPFNDKEISKLAQTLPESYDLRIQNILGPVKNQGSCGSCWAFASVATVEAALAKANGGRYFLSEQSLIDCLWGLKYNNDGCDGGSIDDAYRYMQDHGIPLHSQYGDYIQKNGYCNLDNTTKTFKISNYTILPSGNSDALKLMIVKGRPVAVSIYASKKMKLYSGGLFYDNECEGKIPNHFVVVVGYGDRDGTPYWIVRNSWGENWGQNGYILMSAVNDNCFVLIRPMLPSV